MASKSAHTSSTLSCSSSASHAERLVLEALGSTSSSQGSWKLTFQPRDFRLPPRELLARELAPDTVVAARPTGGHFGSQIRESVQERQHVLLRHGEKVGVLAFCHGLLKFEPQNARMRTAKVTGAVLGQESGSARKEFCQERFLSGRNFVRKGFCQEAGSARKEFCQEGFLSGSGLCQEGILSGRVFVRKRALPGKNFVRKGFCQEAGSAKKEFCQEGFLSGSGLCQERILSGRVFVRKRALPGKFLSGSGLCQERILSGRVFVRKRALPGKNFVRKGFCQEAGSEFCQEGFLSGSGLCQEGGVSFGVGCETVRRRRRRRRLFLFWGGRGASQLWSLV